MKKVYLSISTLLLCGSMLMAQTPANRSAKTVVADVLSQMPAAQQAAYNKLIGELSATGEAGVTALIDMMHAPGKNSNALTDYALSGLTHYVAAKGNEEARLVTANAYLKALEKVSDREMKAFIIRQLELLGKEECVEPLSFYINDQQLSGPAARALASIGGANAGKTLVAGLNNRMGTPTTKKDIIQAIAHAKVAEAEATLLALLGSTDENMQKELLYTLGCVGSKASLPKLAEAAAKSQFTMDKSGANEAYIALIKRVAAQGDVKEAEKAATDLMKKATKANQTHSREAALEILMSVKKAEVTKLLLTALKDQNKNYRNAALTFASKYANKELYVEVAKAMVKANPKAKVDILNWMGREAKCPTKHPIIQGLELRFDLPFSKVLVDQLNQSDNLVKEAAAWTMVLIGDKGYIPVLANLLTSADKQLVLLAQDALAAFPGDIDNTVAKVGATAGDAGKIAALELLAMRKADGTLNAVLEQTKSASPEVKEAAYKALKDVVSEKDFTQMCGMLETAGAKEIVPIQQAIIVTIAHLPVQERVSAVSRRMLQAGESKNHLYYIVLASTGDAKALDTLVAGYKSEQGSAKEAALEALLSWKGIEAADHLFAICQASSSGATFDKALSRYIQLVSNPTFTGENRLLSLRKAMEVAKTDEQKNQILRQVERTGTYLALLFAGQYLDQKPVQQAAANAVMSISLNNKSYTGANVEALLNKVMQVIDNPDAHYHREAIKKHLGEMPKCEGFVSLFNGKDLSGWKGLVENPIARAKMKPEQLAKAQAKADETMRKDWKVENGMLVFEKTGHDNLCTEKQYGDFEMYVDWMLDPAGPEADAGIYLRGTPQVQMWDISRVDVGAQVGSGGLYNNSVHPSKPTKVADNKLGEWNSFYIKMVGDRVTVVLNGEKVVDNVILENYWDRKQPIPAMEQIELQAHGSRVAYRNLYIKELQRPETFKLSAEEQKEGFKVLFDGTNMHEWTGNTVDYVLEEGAISMIPSSSFGGNLYTKQEYGNFVYRFDFQLTPGANNGIGIRTPMGVDAAYHGMEIQVLDCEHPIYKDITPMQHHGAVYGIIATKPDHKDVFKPVGEWNTEEIVANGDNIKVTVNGVVILEGNIREATKNGTPDGKEHPGLFNKKGYIGFLGHGSPVKFRNIRIKELK